MKIINRFIKNLLRGKQILLLFVFLLGLSSSALATEIRVVPDTVRSNYIYDEITFSVSVSDVDSLFAFGCDLIYNSQILEIISITEDNFLCCSDSTINTSFNYDIKGDTITIGMTQLGEMLVGAASQTEQNLFTITAKVLLFGETGLTFSNTTLVKPDGLTEINHTQSDGYCILAYPSDSIRVSFSPEQSASYILEDASISLKIDNVDRLFGFSIDLKYNPNAITIDSLTEGPLLTNSQSGVTFFDYEIDPYSGSITVGGSILSTNDTGVNAIDPTSLFDIHFNAHEYDTSYLTISQIFLLAPNGITNYPIESIDSSLIMTEPLTNSTSIHFVTTDSTIYNSQKFSVQITTENVRRLFGFSAEVIYDNHTLRLDSLTKGLFLNGFSEETFLSYDIDSIMGQVLLGGTILSSSDTGITSIAPLPLAYLHFTAINTGSGSLSFNDISLLAPNGVTTYQLDSIGSSNLYILPTTEMVYQTPSSNIYDSYINQSFPAVNYGNDTLLLVGDNGSMNSLLKFDINNIGANAKISSAYLNLYGGSSLNTDSIGVYPVLTDWQENNLTWDVRPDTGLLQFVSFEDSVTWWSWDMTDLIQFWIDSSQSNFGCYLSSVNADGSLLSFFSSEHLSDTNLTPRLVINYYYPPDCPDLVVSSDYFDVSQDIVIEGDNVQLTSKIFNTGSSAVSSIEVSFYHGKPGLGQYQLIDNVIIPFINSFDYELVQVNWNTNGYDGDNTILVWVNPLGLISECDTLNNKMSFFEHVFQKPNLYSDCSLINLSNDYPTEGETIQINTIIGNDGEASIDSFKVSIYVDNNINGLILLDSLSVMGPLNFMQRDTLQFTWNTDNYPGNSNIIIEIDKTDWVIEQDENDNNINCPITVYNPSVIMNIETVTESQPNDTVLYNISITNNGLVAADTMHLEVNYPIEFSLSSYSLDPDSGFNNVWTLNPLSPDSSINIQLELIVSPSAISGSVVDILSHLDFSNEFGFGAVSLNENNSVVIGDDVIPPQIIIDISPNLISTDTVFISCLPSEILLENPVVIITTASEDTLNVIGPDSLNGTYYYKVYIDETIPSGKTKVFLSVTDLNENIGESITYFDVDHNPPLLGLIVSDTLSLGSHALTLSTQENLSEIPLITFEDSLGNLILINYTNKSGLNYNYHFDIEALNSSGLAYFQIYAIDFVGNDTTLYDTIYIQNVLPEITAQTSEYFGLGNNYFDISINREISGYPIASGTDINGFALNINGPYMNGDDYTFSCHVDEFVAEGMADILISATDLFGNTGTLVFQVNIDRSPPLFSLLPQSNLITGDSTIVVSSSEKLFGAPLLLSYDIRGNLLPSFVLDSTFFDSIYFFSSNYSDSIGAVEIEGTDLSGNTNTQIFSSTDLSIQQDQLIFSSTPGLEGDVTISSYIHNTGYVKQDSVHVEIWSDYPGVGIVIDTSIYITILPGDSTFISANWLESLQSTSYIVYVVIDPDNNHRESDETNNVTWKGSIRTFSFANKSQYINGIDTTVSVYSQVMSLNNGSVYNDAMVSVVMSVKDSTNSLIIENESLVYDTLLKHFRGNVDVNQYLQQGDYWFFVTADAGGGVGVVLDSFDVSVLIPVTISCTTEFSEYYRDNDIYVSGQLLFSDLSPASNYAVDIIIESNGGMRLYQTVSDNNGDFNYSFSPSTYEAGQYKAIARFVYAELNFDDTTEFIIQGGLISPNNYNLTMSRNSDYDLNLSFSNIGPGLITLDSFFVDGPSLAESGIDFVIDLSETDFVVQASQSTTFSVNVSASYNALDYSEYVVYAYFNDSIIETSMLNITTQSASPNVLASPGIAEFYMNLNSSMTKQVSLQNKGFTAWRDVEIKNTLPDYLSASLPPEFDSLEVGSELVLELNVNVLSEMTEGVYDTALIISSSNHADVIIPIRTFVSSGTQGSISFNVSSEQGEQISNAKIDIYSQTYDPITKSYLVYNGVSDTNGVCEFLDIPTGPYIYKVSNDNYNEKTGDLVVQADQPIETTESVIMSPVGITYDWSVNDTSVTETGTVTVNITYNTSVPVLVMTPHILIHEGEKNEVIIGSFNLKNIGMRDADLITYDLPSSNNFTFSFNGTQPSRLFAGESVNVGYRIVFANNVDYCEQYRDWITLTAYYNDMGFSGSTESFGEVIVNGLCGDISVKPSAIYIFNGPCDNDLTDPNTYITSQELTAKNISHDPITMGRLYAARYSIPYTSLASFSSLASVPFINTGWSPKFILAGQESKNTMMSQNLPYIGASISVGVAVIDYYWRNQHRWKNIPIITAGFNLFGFGCQGCSGCGSGGTGPSTPRIEKIPGPPAFAENGGIVKLVISQKLSIERQAFTADLDISNMSAYNIENFDIDIKLKDENDFLIAENQYTTDNPLFFANPELTGLNDVDGTGTIGMSTTANAHWLIIPKTDAGGFNESGKEYKLSAKISYSVGGIDYSFETQDETITVLPQPKLRIKYFVPYLVNDNSPFSLGVSVRNVGHGTATNLRIDSEQAVVLSGAQYLHYFKILGAYTNGDESTATIIKNFGDIPPGGAAVSRWRIIASPGGTIDDMSVSYKHDDVLGGITNSLIESVSTNRIIRGDLRLNQNVENEAPSGFLVDFNSDLLPDMIYDMDNGDSIVVNNIQADSTDQPSFENANMKIYIQPSDDWIYLKVSEPFLGTKNITSILREDGTEVVDNNYWSDSSYIYLCDQPNNNSKYIVQYENIIYKPDISILDDDLVISPCSNCNTIDAGDSTVIVNIKVTNLGNLTMPSSYMYLYDGDYLLTQPFDSILVDSLIPSQIQNYEYVWQTGPPSDWLYYYHRLYIVTDPHNLTNELIELNNIASTGIDFDLEVGDLDHTDFIDISDAVYAVNWIFLNGTSPIPVPSGDVNCDSLGDIRDIIYLVNYMFKGGAEPCNKREPNQKLIPDPDDNIEIFTEQLSRSHFQVLVNSNVSDSLAGLQQIYSYSGDSVIIDSIILSDELKGMGLYWSTQNDSLKIGVLDIYGKQLPSIGEQKLFYIFYHTSKINNQSSILKHESTLFVNSDANAVSVNVIEHLPKLQLIPNRFFLNQNYPNPFNPSTQIEYGLPVAGNVKLTIYNILGQTVTTLVNKHQAAGYYQVLWDSNNNSSKEVASGVYFYRISVEDYTESKKMVIIK